jgi:biopolymer transport protein ExbB/TolQ
MWSSADYTLEQYAAACLVAPPADQLKSKIQCKLPIKTPNGVLNRAGVHAAAAALAGARGGVQLTADERKTAEKKLRAAYKKLDEQPPPSLAHALVALVQALDEDAQHHGIKGQKWGVRRAIDAATGRVEQKGTTGLSAGLKPRTSSADQIAADRIAKKIQQGGLKAVSNADAQAYVRRLQVQKDLKKALDEQSAAEKAKADGFIKSFVNKQASRQVNRVLDKSLDVAVEAALNQAGIKVKKNNPLLGQGMQDVSLRLKPKKGK